MRNPSGARVGAILQGLIAREPIERRPVIRGWLPSEVHPPQVTSLSSSVLSATDPVVFFHLRDDLRIRQLVRGLDSHDALGQRFGVAQTLLQL